MDRTRAAQQLGDETWRAPSVPIAELSNQLEYEVRVASVDIAGELPVEVWYLHAHATGNVDIIAATNRFEQVTRGGLLGSSVQVSGLDRDPR